MVSGYERDIANQAIYSMSRITAPANPVADFEKGVNGVNYNPKDRYEGRVSIADAVGKQDKQLDLYQKPVKSMRENNPEKDIYASLLNYEFMS